jgi:hypothetical protein
MKATLIALVALAVGIAAGIGVTTQEFGREVIPVDITPVGSGPGTRPAAKIGPKVTIVNGERHDFGSMDRNAHGKHAYIVRNDGDAPLELETGQVSCGVCIKVFAVANPIVQPGERTEVKIEWDVKTSDAEFEQSGPLKTNDKNRPSVHLSIKGHVIDTVRADRSDVHFSDLSPNESASASVNIYAFRDADLEIEQHSFSSAKAQDFVSVSFSPLADADLAREPKAKGGKKMNIEIKPGLPHGDFEGTISVTTNQGSEPLSVKVIGNVASDILLMGPNVVREKLLVSLGAFSQKEGKKHTIFLIVKGPHRDETKVEIASVEPTTEFSAKLGEPVRDTAKTIRYPIVIEIPPGAAPGARTEGTYGKIRISTTHPDVKDLEVKVRYVVKE